uniref:Uncharacterized protein n=1 Tax=Neolamprologus brichardi TaxID=32507 RepID=A0A3Q4ICL2_NEOBR
MNILPRLLYLFQTLPIPIDSRWGLSSLKNYFRAAQLKTVVNWCDTSYQAHWKTIEESMFSSPIQAVLMDSNIREGIDKVCNPWVSCTLNIWRKVVKEFKLEQDLALFKSYSYDSDFVPNKLDSRFKSWSAKGLSTFDSLIKDGNFISFDTLKQKYNLEKQDFYRYLQIRHYIKTTIGVMSNTNVELVTLFRQAYSGDVDTRLISFLYNFLINKFPHSTDYVKMLWEKEGGMCISRDEWTQMWERQWRSTSSNSWREFGWKSMIRFFITPCQKAHYDGNPPVCWRNCGHQRAHHTHIMWDCPVLRTHWKDIHGTLQGIFDCTLPLDMKTIVFGCIPLKPPT